MPFFDSLDDKAGPPAVYTRYPEIYAPWSEMSQAMMNGPSPLSQGERELILAYAAGLAGCDFVYIAHSEVAYAWGIPDGAIAALLEDPATAPLDDRLKTLLALVRKLTLAPADVTRADIDAATAAGWSEDAIHDAVAVTGRAAYMARLVCAYGFTPMTREAAAKKAPRRIEHGYVNLYPEFRKEAGKE